MRGRKSILKHLEMSKPDSQSKEDLARLVSRGAILTLMFHNPLNFLVGDIFFCVGDMVMYSSIFPEDQHHVHDFKLLAIKKHHDNGFRLRIQMDEETLTAYLFAIEPYERRQVRAFKEWQKYRSKHSKDFNRFYEQLIHDYRFELDTGK